MTGVASALVEEIGYPMFPPPLFVALLSQDIAETCLSFRTKVDEGRRRSQLFLLFVSSSCHCLPEGAFVPWKRFGLVDTVPDNSFLLWLEALKIRIGERAPPHGLFDPGC